MMFRSVAGLCLLATLSGHAQSFWQPTSTAPEGGAKRGLVATGPSTLLTTVAAGLLLSPDRGQSWRLVRRTSSLYSLLATRDGALLAGGRGKVFRSFDGGANWDSIALKTSYPVQALLETNQGDLVAGTGEDEVGGLEAGDGAFYSANKGHDWVVWDQGFGSGRYVNHLATDQHGQLYATIANSWENNQPGLYVATGPLGRWQHLPLVFPVFGPVKANRITCLAVSPQDSLQCSFDGAVGPAALSANVVKAVKDVADATQPWRVRGGVSNQQVLRPPLPTLFFSRQGIWYSSRPGGQSNARFGTLRSTDFGHSWTLETGGLGWSVNGFREEQFFAELPDGAIFMVQEGDEQAYWHQDTPMAARPGQVLPELRLFPNPTAEEVELSLGANARPVALRLLGPTGSTLAEFPPTTRRVSLAALPAGLYWVLVTLADGQTMRQRVVRR